MDYFLFNFSGVQFHYTMSLNDFYSTKSEIVYFKGCNINTGAITIINHENTYVVSSLGVKTLPSLEKY